MRARGQKPEPGQRWQALSWKVALGPPRVVEVVSVFGDGAYVTVKRITGTGPDERRLLTESLLAKYELLPAEDVDGRALRGVRLAAGDRPGGAPQAQAETGSDAEAAGRPA